MPRFTRRKYVFIGHQYLFQGTTSYVPSAGVAAFYVECVGGGGGGGGTAGGANAGAGGGGGGGAYSVQWFTAIKTYACVVGAGGNGGTAGNNPGLVGADTTFDSPSNCTAKGGGAGPGSATAAATQWMSDGGAGGAQASCVGLAASGGGCGGCGLVLSAGQALAGYGGASVFGPSAKPTINANAQGTAGTLYGGGGTGGVVVSGGAAVAGGAGGNGWIRVWEYGL